MKTEALIEDLHAQEKEAKKDKILNALENVRKVDLSKLYLNLLDTEKGPGWGLEKTQEVETDYRLFMASHVAFPELSFAPSKEVDTFWHHHILDTEAYAE